MTEAEVERLFRKLDRIENVLVEQAESNGKNFAEHKALIATAKRIEDHAVKTNGRVTSLESKWLKVSGAIVILVPLFSFLFKLIL